MSSLLTLALRAKQSKARQGRENYTSLGIDQHFGLSSLLICPTLTPNQVWNLVVDSRKSCVHGVDGLSIPQEFTLIDEDFVVRCSDLAEAA